MISLLLVEDHEAVRTVFSRHLRRQSEFELRAMVETGEEALQWLAAQEKPEEAVDVVLVDLSLPGMNGIALVEELRSQYPSQVCFILSGYKDRHHVQRALDAGARGYVVKDDVQALARGIRRAYEGEIFLSEGLER